jgi:hypothetical protein
MSNAANRHRTFLVCMGGIMAGALTAYIVPWSAVPKSAAVGVVAAIVALGIGFAVYIPTKKVR